MSKQIALTWAETHATAKYADDEMRTLIRRCLSGDDSAYITLYNQNSGRIYRLAYSLLRNQEDAEEVLQDSFEYAFRKLANYNPQKSAFTTWLYRITVSRCHNKRRRKWLPTFSLNQFLGEEQDIKDNDTPTPDDVLALTERQKVVWDALSELTPKLRETAVLRYYHGLRYAEIGKILDIPSKTAESRMRLAHKALKKIITL